MDVYAPPILRLSVNGTFASFSMPRPIGSFVFRQGGRLIAALKATYCEVVFEAGAVTPVVNPEPDFPNSRLNDG